MNNPELKNAISAWSTSDFEGCLSYCLNLPSGSVRDLHISAIGDQAIFDSRIDDTDRIRAGALLIFQKFSDNDDFSKWIASFNEKCKPEKLMQPILRAMTTKFLLAQSSLPERLFDLTRELTPYFQKKTAHRWTDDILHYNYVNFVKDDPSFRAVAHLVESFGHPKPEWLAEATQNAPMVMAAYQAGKLKSKHALSGNKKGCRSTL